MRVVACLLAVSLGACTPAVQDQLTREAARATITPVVVERFPGVPVEPALDCIIDNASSAQLLSLAADTVTGPNAATAQIVSDIASQPETLSCFAASYSGALLASGG